MQNVKFIISDIFYFNHRLRKSDRVRSDNAPSVLLKVMCHTRESQLW